MFICHNASTYSCVAHGYTGTFMMRGIMSSGADGTARGRRTCLSTMQVKEQPTQRPLLCLRSKTIQPDVRCSCAQCCWPPSGWCPGAATLIRGCQQHCAFLFRSTPNQTSTCTPRTCVQLETTPEHVSCNANPCFWALLAVRKSASMSVWSIRCSVRTDTCWLLACAAPGSSSEGSAELCVPASSFCLHTSAGRPVQEPPMEIICQKQQ